MLRSTVKTLHLCYFVLYKTNGIRVDKRSVGKDHHCKATHLVMQLPK